MQDIIIRELTNKDDMPYNLLLLADPSIEIVKEYVSRGISYIAINNDAIVGVYVLIKTRPDTIELVNIAVDESMHGKGIGKRLVKHSIEQAKSLHAKVLEVGTGNSSISQLALYQKCGFRISGVDKDFFVRHYDEDIFENGIQCIDMIRLSMDL